MVEVRHNFIMPCYAQVFPDYIHGHIYLHETIMKKNIIIWLFSSASQNEAVTLVWALY